MKRILYAVLLSACASSAYAADTVVTISVGQPGFYGQISIGNFPQPQLVYAQPVIIQPPPAIVVAPAAIYLHVPPGHEKHWSKHCAAYNACGRPVYFVRDDWYNNVYVPHYQQKSDDEGHGRHGHGHDKGDDDDQGHGHHDH